MPKSKSPWMVAGSWRKRVPFLVALTAAAVCLNGCLTRTSGPPWPYVKAAESVPERDQTRVHLAARMEAMETEMQRLRQMIELTQASGGESRAVSNLESRVTFIERQLGIEPPVVSSSPASTYPAPVPPPPGSHH